MIQESESLPLHQFFIHTFFCHILLFVPSLAHDTGSNLEITIIENVLQLLRDILTLAPGKQHTILDSRLWPQNLLSVPLIIESPIAK
eukprot:g15528.t1